MALLIGASFFLAWYIYWAFLFLTLKLVAYDIGEMLNRKGDKVCYFYDYARKPGQRPSTGVFTYVNPKTLEQKNFNREVLKILETKKNLRIVEQQAIGTPYIPSFKFKENFFDYYGEYVKQNKREGNRHLPNSFAHFKAFLGKDFIPQVEITESL